MQKAVKMYCKGCGGSLEMVDNSHAVCKYCGSRYLLDNAKGLVAEVNLAYGDEKKTKDMLKLVSIVLGIFAIVALVVVYSIWQNNVKARNSELAATTQQSESTPSLSVPLQKEPHMLFCEEVFAKPYLEITKEELEQIKYLGYDIRTDEIYYSFTDYQECASEEEFQRTIKAWENHDYSFRLSDFTGLTRLEAREMGWYDVETLSKEAPITYLEVEALCLDVPGQIGMDTSKIETLVVDAVSWGEYLKYLPDYSNVRELYIDGTSIYFGEDDERIDISKITMLPKLERLRLGGYGQVYDHLELLSQIPTLKSLTLDIMNKNYENVDFLTGLAQIEELRISSLPEEFDASVFGKLTNLKALCLPEWTQLSAELIVALPNLQVVKGIVTDRATVEEISRLSDLQEVDLRFAWEEAEVEKDKEVMPLIDMEPFAQKPNLRYVRMYGASYDNVEMLLNHPKLEKLDFNYLILQSRASEVWIDTSQLSENAKVVQLSFNSCSLKDSATGAKLDLGKLLGHYPLVELLELDDCRLVSVEPIAECKYLRECSLRRNKISDFSPLQECKSLELVHVYENPEESINSINLSPEVEVDKEIELDW